MILKSPKSRLSVVNLFADFILNKIPKEHQTIIQVIDCHNFFVIKGKTTHSEILNMGEIINEFKTQLPETFNSKKLSHTIDLIEYNQKLSEVDNITFTYHNTENCSYSYEQIDAFLLNDEKSYDYNFHLKTISDDTFLSILSEFPYGYSLGQGRLNYYYGKYIMYNIPPTYYINNLTMTIGKNPEETFECDDEELKSPILDMFDFDMKWLETEIKKVDWSIELTNPLKEYDCLKVKVKDFLII
jgi:hypothetical protein